MAGKLHTLTEVSKRTGISMPTLQRYKKLYQDRIPSEGSGRTQRYPTSSLAVFRQLKKENIGRRGRPRKNPLAPAEAAKPAAAAAKKVPKKAAKAAAGGSGLLTLTQIGKMTKISYPTLLRYVKMNLKSIPHSGTGRARRYLPDAVAIFKRLREESRRGRAPGKGKKKATAKGGPARKVQQAAAAGADVSVELTARVKELEKVVKKLQRELIRVEKKSTKPYRITLQR